MSLPAYRSRPGAWARLSFSCALLPALAAAPLWGQTPGAAVPLTELEAVTVTATRITQPVFSVPYTAHVIDRRDFLERMAVRTLPDALKETPGVMIQKTSYGQSSPFIRGFTGFRTLMLVDGIRLNNAVFREGPNQYWSTVDLSSVEQLDIVKGPSSVLYGSDAIGGTVNTITVRPPFADSSPLEASRSITFRPSAYFRHGTAENSQVGRAAFSLGAGPNLGIHAGSTWKRFDDLRAGDGTGGQPGSGYRERAADVKLRFRATPDLEITGAYQLARQDDVPRTHATTFSRSFAGSARGTDLQRSADQQRELSYVQAQWRNPAPWVSSVRMSLSLHRQSEEQDRIRSNGRREITGFRDDQYGALLHLESKSAVGILNYGVEYYFDDVSSAGTDIQPNGARRALPRGPVADDARHQLLGLYLQDQFRFAGRFEVTAGIRYSHASANAEKVDPDLSDAVRFGPLDKSNGAATASARLACELTRNVNLFAGTSQGFRAPNISDYTSFELARTGERETPAPDLRPERYVSLEVGTKARIPHLHTEIYAAYFHTYVQDQITRFPTGRMIETEREVTKANTGDGLTRGAEFGATVRLGRRVSLFGNAAWLEGDVDTYVGNTLRREPASRIQPITGLAGARWHESKRRFWAEVVGQFAGRQSRLSPGDTADTQRIPPGGTPGYSVYHLRTGWRIRPSLTLTTAIENLFNEDYRIHGSGINEPGTNLVASLQLNY